MKSRIASVAREARALCDLVERELVAQPQAPDLANHVHGDHLESPAEILSRSVEDLGQYGLALCGLAGQDCIGTNSTGRRLLADWQTVMCRLH